MRINKPPYELLHKAVFNFNNWFLPLSHIAPVPEVVDIFNVFYRTVIYKYGTGRYI